MPTTEAAVRRLARHKRIAGIAQRITPLLFSDEEAAHYLGVSPDIILRLVNTGHLSEVRIPSANERAGGKVRRLLLDRRELDECAVSWRHKRTED